MFVKRYNFSSLVGEALYNTVKSAYTELISIFFYIEKRRIKIGE